MLKRYLIGKFVDTDAVSKPHQRSVDKVEYSDERDQVSSDDSH